MTKNSPKSKEDAADAASFSFNFRSPVITTCLVVIALCIGGYAFSYLKAVLSPLLIALFIYFLTNPIVRVLQARGCSPTLSYLLVLLMTITTFSSLGWVLFGSLQEINNEIGNYKKNLSRVVDQIESPFVQTMEFFGIDSEENKESESTGNKNRTSANASKGEEASTSTAERQETESQQDPSVTNDPLPAPEEPSIEERVADLMERAVQRLEDRKDQTTNGATKEKQEKTTREKMDGMLGDLFTSGSAEILNHVIGTSLEYIEITLMTIFYLFFILIESHKLPKRIKRGFAYESTQTLMEMGHSIQRSIEQYLRVKTGVSAGLGLTTGLISLLFGLDFWLLWAGFMFLANYVTYIGSMVALAPPIAIAFLQFQSPLGAAVLSVLLIANRFFWIDYAEIKLSGQHLNVSPVILLLSIALFGALWGVIGMVLAVPVVTSVKIALSQFESTSHLASLLSED
jgi:predicted PurR-regulated permease PerM